MDQQIVMNERIFESVFSLAVQTEFQTLEPQDPKPACYQLGHLDSLYVFNIHNFLYTNN